VKVMIASMDDVRLDDPSPNDSVAVEEAVALADTLLAGAGQFGAT
jgi:hypothetical protein